jgi:hypothetical protein
VVKIQLVNHWSNSTLREVVKYHLNSLTGVLYLSEGFCMALPRSFQELIAAIRCLVSREFTNSLPLRYHGSVFTFVAQAACVSVSPYRVCVEAT